MKADSTRIRLQIRNYDDKKGSTPTTYSERELQKTVIKDWRITETKIRR
jgi:hypothetical protein